VAGIRDRFLDDLRSHRWTPEWFGKTETLHDSLEVYRQKRSRAGGTPRPLRARPRLGRPFNGDQITYYVTGKTKTVRAFENAKLASRWSRRTPTKT